MKVVFTKHAAEMLSFRRIKKEFVEETVKNPDDTLEAKSGKMIYFKDFGKNFLKVVVAKEDDKAVVITEHWIAKKRIKK